MAQIVFVSVDFHNFNMMNIVNMYLETSSRRKDFVAIFANGHFFLQVLPYYFSRTITLD